VPKRKRGIPLDELLAAQLVEPPRLIGYARVSTDVQTTRLQLDALKAAGCERIFEDKESGALRSRPKLDRALAELRPGDTLVVWRLDRLGRSLRHLLEMSEMLRDRGVALRSLTEHIDTATAAGKMLYAILGAVAQFERDARHRAEASTSAGQRRSNRPRCGRLGRCSTEAKARRTLRACSASVVRPFTGQSREHKSL
jgi:DNA invertase Pin-like site-specific DNA recombinase